MQARIEKLGLKGATVALRDRELVATLPRGNVELAVSVLLREGRIEVFDLQGDLLRPTIDAQGFPRPSRSRLHLKKHSAVLGCGPGARYCPGVPGKPLQAYYYLFRYEPGNQTHPVPELTNADFAAGSIRQDIDPQTGEPIISLRFTSTGAKKFTDLTLKLAERGRVVHNRIGGAPPNAFQQFTIVIDREIVAAPTISYEDTPHGISGNSGAQITGIGSIGGAKDLALVLQTGPLPAPFYRVASE